MLGGSVFAVATAVRLARVGHNVTLVHKGRRLGSFPFILLTQNFLKELGVEASHHSEAETVTCSVDGEIVKIPTPLHLCRTTPLLEEALAYNEIRFSYKTPYPLEREVIDCEARPWKDLKLFQAVYVKKQNNQSCLKVEGKKGHYVSVTFYAEKLAVDYIYSTYSLEKPNGALAFIERPIAYINPQDRRLLPITCLAGQDMAEIINNEAVLKNTSIILEFLKGFRQHFLKDYFVNIFPYKG